MGRIVDCRLTIAERGASGKITTDESNADSFYVKACPKAACIRDFAKRVMQVSSCDADQNSLPGFIRRFNNGFRGV